MDFTSKKVNKRIRFTDRKGNPMLNAEICVKQTNHKFLFGCG